MVRCRARLGAGTMPAGTARAESLGIAVALRPPTKINDARLLASGSLTCCVAAS
jgi:hypothetical protein